MWGGPSAYINVTFDSASQGEAALVIYEWKDVQYLGKERRGAEEDDLPRIYICTSNAMAAGYCMADQLGRFILDLPSGKTINSTSFWSERVQLPANKTTISPTSVSVAEFWNNPSGNPTPPASNHTSPWRRERRSLRPVSLTTRQFQSRDDHGLYEYNGPIHYPVTTDGFYCVAIVPITGEQPKSSRRAGTDVPYHPSYHGNILFKNVFQGHLAASDYPKVTFYFSMFLCYVVFGIVWAWLSYRHLQDLHTLQYYIAGLIGLLIIEMLATWVYYRYLNAHGPGTASTIFLIVVAILDAGRNSMSFLLLLLVALGLSVVRESLGRTMIKCQALAVAHFIFGVIYAIGIVELELESTSALILLLFIIPLAFTLSGFLLWIMYALNGTIQQLEARKQRYKLKMFKRLHYILYFVVLSITVFFFISSMSFSGRGQQEDAEDYDLEAIQSRSRQREDDDDDDAATLVGGRRNEPLPGENVVFEIGDEDEDDDDTAAKKQRKPERLSGDNEQYRSVGGHDDEERQDLMGRSRND
ncbi:hypothetical protein EST38_g6688 [Candolleomyces aberdarensis]|uniref:Uncharacterized protein n=1 Tax=Candolleomyces aberdarensis TaxID=2316362 RepID=A0A4Q2DH55_9AGAR|nr:hypothetical protein EST38_g6688 [Candolleomyces aberdarensis]